MAGTYDRKPVLPRNVPGLLQSGRFDDRELDPGRDQPVDQRPAEFRESPAERSRASLTSRSMRGEWDAPSPNGFTPQRNPDDETRRWRPSGPRDMNLDLVDKVAVVTGANRGIGLAVTHALVAEGAHVVAGSLTTDKSLAQEFGPHGIRVSCVSPGQVSTDLWLGDHGVAATIGKATGVDADTVREAALADIATGRFTTPEEVATLVTMLASERVANVTGVNYVIDGGLIKTT